RLAHRRQLDAAPAELDPVVVGAVLQPAAVLVVLAAADPVDLEQRAAATVLDATAEHRADALDLGDADPDPAGAVHRRPGRRHRRPGNSGSAGHRRRPATGLAD